MHRFYLPPEKCGGERIVLDEGEAHHALRVLRVRAGDDLVVLDGVGSIYDCRVTNTGPRSLELSVTNVKKVAALPWQITLFQAIPKGKIFENIVEKATELGVSRIVPILSERVVATPEKPERKLEKWKATAVEAIKQCGSPWLPQIVPPTKLEKAADREEQFDLNLVATLEGERHHPRHWLDLIASAGPRSLRFGVWIGPEGDFSPREVDLLERAAARRITLGSLVLRAETAAVYCLSVLNYEMQWRSKVSSWT